MSLPLRTLGPDEQPSAQDWNRLVAHLQTLGGTVTGNTFGELGMTRYPGGGTGVFDQREKSHWAKISSRGSGNKYAHNSVAPDDDGTFEDLPSDADNPYGSTTELFAAEVNGNVDFDSDLPVYVRVRPNPAFDSTDDPAWLFEYTTSGGSYSFQRNDMVGDFAITGGALTWQDVTGSTSGAVSITLPSAGTYRLSWNVTAVGFIISPSTGTPMIGVRIHDSDIGAGIAATEGIVLHQNGFVSLGGSHVYTTTGSTTVKLQTYRNGLVGGSWNRSDILWQGSTGASGTGEGATNLTAEKMA